MKSEERGTVVPACCAAADPAFSAAFMARGLVAMRKVTWSCCFGFTFASYSVRHNHHVSHLAFPETIKSSK